MNVLVIIYTSEIATQFVRSSAYDQYTVSYFLTLLSWRQEALKS